MGYITPDGFKHLDNYKYISNGYSFLETHVLNHFWERFVNILPMWLAPNLITFIGFIFMALSYLIMLPFDQTLANDIPQWIFFVSAFFQHIYQTFDAIDGKQARRTKGSSPLGQLFDHGCDSFSTSFLILSISQATKLGADKETFFVMVTTVSVIFWISMWSEFHTKVLKTHVFNIGIAEGQLIMQSILILTGIFGQNFWVKPVGDYIPNFLSSHLPAFAMQMTPKFYIMYGTVALALFLISFMFINTFRATKDRAEAILQHIPVLMLLGLNFLWRPTGLYTTNIGVVTLIFGINFSLVTTRMIVCSLTEMTFPKLHRELAFLTLATALVRRDLFLPNLKLGFDLDRAVLIASLIFTVLSALQWSSQLISEITSHLGIYCFSLKKRPKMAKTD
jgi:phosphatidylglycerophosphate synthase